MVFVLALVKLWFFMLLSACWRRLRGLSKMGMKIYGVPVNIGHEDRRGDGGPDSTWFTGYNEKFFYDRGVLYKYLYGAMKKPFRLCSC